MATLSPNQIKDIARAVACIEQHIVAFYDNPDNEKAYQEWYFRKYCQNKKESES